MKRRELTIEERNKIIGAYQCGTAPATIARTLGFPATTVYGTIDRYRKTGTAQPKTRPGRPPSLDDRDQRVLKRIVLAGRRKPLGEITNETNARLNTSLSPNTIRKYMAKAGFSNRRARKKPLLSEKNVEARLGWCQERQKWDEEWKKVVFSDESRFCLFHSDGRVRVWRKPGEEYLPDCLEPTVKFSGGSVMVWGCFSWWEGGAAGQGRRHAQG